MRRGVDLWRHLKVTADVDDLRSAFWWEERAHDVDARGLAFGHHDVGEEDVWLGARSEKVLERGEIRCLLNAERHVSRHGGFDELAQRSEALRIIVKEQ